MVTAIIGKAPYKTEVTATGHHLLADEAEEVGGGDTGPSPGQFLQIALATCTAITLRMYANRRDMALESVRVEVGTERIEGGTRFQRHIYIDGTLDEAQKQKLLEIANACPVHRTLTHPIEIETSIETNDL